jgi:rod shape-determining protein MreC
MEALLGRYRNLTVLVMVIVAQLLYLAYQIKTSGDERLIRVWAVTGVTPMAGIVEAIRGNTLGFFQDYFYLLDVRDQNRRLKSDNDKLRMENVYFREQLATAENARALTLFQAQVPSKTMPARVIGNSTVATAKAVFIDRGSSSGVENGMAVVTPDGIVGKVSATYPLVSQVLLVTDPTFGVGVESQKGHVHGVLNCGTGNCVVSQIQNEDKVDVGEWFFTSGEDRIFAKGFPVGIVSSVALGQGMKDVKISLSGAPGGAEEVLVVLKGVHRNIPTVPVVEQANADPLPAPPPEGGPNGPLNPKPQTEADKILQKYSEIGKEQNHVFGAYGSNLPNFNPKPASAATAAPAALKTPAPAVPAQVPPASGVLGSRPNAPPPGTATGNASGDGPVLPLGAPRHRTTAASGTTRTDQQ